MLINLTVPTAWSELTQAQIKYACFLLSSGHYDEYQVKALCLIRWSKLKPIGYNVQGYEVEHDGKAITIQAEQIAPLLPEMDWLLTIPDRPVRMEQIRQHEAVNADLQGVPFEHYLALDNLYQGYMHTKRHDLLEEMTTMLYGERLSLTPAEAYSVFLWFASVKRLFAVRFPHFFVPAPVRTEEEVDGAVFAELQRSMNMQIRALTKGDITKEKEILSMDTWRALTELDAQAEEYEELKRQYNAK